MRHTIRGLLYSVILGVLIPGVIYPANTGKISGQVVDGESGEPLPGVNVIIEETSLGAATNANGQYFILNVPPGTYSVTARMIGYKKFTKTNVRVRVDLTTKINFELETEIIGGEEVVVEASRPAIQQDETASRTIKSGDEMLNMPIDDFEGALATVTGAVTDQDGQLHLRGGRTQEVTYLLDNTTMVDPLTGNNDNELSNLVVEETHVLTGGFSAEYGNAQSGVVNVITKDGSKRFTGKVRYTTSDYGLGSQLSTVRTDEVPEELQRVELSASGPVNFLPGELTYILNGDFTDTQGRYMNQSRTTNVLFGKVTYRPDPKITIRLNGLYNDENRDYFANLWKKKVFEDRQLTYQFRDDDGDGLNDNRNYLPGWIGNGQLDTEDTGLIGEDGERFGAGNGYLDFIDVNGNGVWDPGEPTEDINRNGTLDSEDLNHNGDIDIFNMLNHLSNITQESNQLGISMVHQVTDKTFYEFKVHRYYTRQFMNAREKVNEDIDGDGKIDARDEWIQTASGEYQWIDLDNDGYFDRGDEDLNGNGIVDEYGTDLYADRNRNEYVDASEIGPAPREYYQRMGIPDPESQWMRWEDIPYQGQKDYDGFYTYGIGTTWDRRSWYEDESSLYGLKFDIDSQILFNHRVRSGIDVTLKDLFRYDGTDRYGYGEKFNVKPYQFAFYIQDKMEYGGMIMNIGVRYDYFNANWDNYPNNDRDPTWDRDEVKFGGNEDANNNGRLDAGEDLNGNGYLDQDWVPSKYRIGTDDEGFPVYRVYPGDIKDPRTVPAQDFISPRFGVSYPITEHDKMFFSYGNYFSAPLGTNLYRNLEFDLGGGFPVIGNPNLKPEKTTAYEAGVAHAFRNRSTLELKGFFKNITGLTNSKPIYFTQRDWYALYYNSDYGTVRGFEVNYTQQPTKIGPVWIGGLTNYTYQIAKNKNSDTFDGYLTAWAGDVFPTEESYTDWDQRHTLNLNLDVRTRNQDLGNLWGGWSMNMLYRYGSGARWTPPKGQDRAALDNTAVMPEKHTVDARFGKYVTIGQTNLEFFLDVRNLFDRKNIVDIADEEWYALADTDGDGNPDHDPQGKYDDPTVYERGRLVRAGIKLDF